MFQQSLEGMLYAGRPFGSEQFIRQVEKTLGFGIQKKKQGPKKNMRGQTTLDQPVLDFTNNSGCGVCPSICSHAGWDIIRLNSYKKTSSPLEGED